MDPFYKINDHETAPFFRLYLGREAVNFVGNRYRTVSEAKADCWKRFHAIATRVHASEVPFDPKNALHAALARIEARHSGMTSVVAVESNWYMSRKTKFAVENQVSFRVIKDSGDERCYVYARHDVESFVEAQDEDSFSETVPGVTA